MVVPSDYADEYDKLFNDFSDKDLDSISFAPFSYDGKHLVISIVTTKEARSNPKRLPPHFTVDINGEKAEAVDVWRTGGPETASGVYLIPGRIDGPGTVTSPLSLKLGGMA